MEMDKYLNKEDWKNITPHLTVGMHNMKDGFEYQMILHLYCDTMRNNDGKDMLQGASIGSVTGNGIEIRKDHPKYHLKLLKIEVDNASSFLLSNKGFIIFAKLRKYTLKD